MTQRKPAVGGASPDDKQSPGRRVRWMLGIDTERLGSWCVRIDATEYAAEKEPGHTRQLQSNSCHGTGPQQGQGRLFRYMVDTRGNLDGASCEGLPAKAALLDGLSPSAGAACDERHSGFRRSVDGRRWRLPPLTQPRGGSTDRARMIRRG